MISRRKNVEQIRQSLCVEIAWQNSHVRRSPSTRHDLVVQRIPLQQRVERDGRVRERPLHVRHPTTGGRVRGGQFAGRPGARRTRRPVRCGPSAHPRVGGRTGIGSNGTVRELHPGSELAGYRIESVEREDEGAAVLLARDPSDERAVTLHVAGEPPGSLSTTRFLERARRLGSVEHPHLLGVYGARTLEGRAVAVAQAPPGRRLDELIADGPLRPGAGGPDRAPGRLRGRRARGRRRRAAAADRRADLGRRRRRRPPRRSRRRRPVAFAARAVVLGGARGSARRHDAARAPRRCAPSSPARATAPTCPPASSPTISRDGRGGAAAARRRQVATAVALIATLITAAILLVSLV